MPRPHRPRTTCWSPKFSGTWSTGSLESPGLWITSPEGDRASRAEAFAAALRRVRTDGGERTRELLECATILGSIRLDRPTMERIVKEVLMTAESIAEFWRDGEIGQLLVQEGRHEGRAELLLTLLRGRFGDLDILPEVAERLADWPRTEDAVRAISSATHPDELPQGPASS